MRQTANRGTCSVGASAPTPPFLSLLLLVLLPSLLAAEPALAQEAFGGNLDARMLLTLGITLGMIAFSIGSAIACLRATQSARRMRDAALIEAEQSRAGEETLEAIIAGEQQTLLSWTNGEAAKLHAANLAPELGVPNEALAILRFHDWLTRDSAELLAEAIERLENLGAALPAFAEDARKPTNIGGWAYCRKCAGSKILRRESGGRCRRFRSFLCRRL